MKKQIVAFLAIVILCVLNAVPVFAAETVGSGIAVTGGLTEQGAGTSGNTHDGGSRIIWDEDENADRWVAQNGGEVTVDDAVSWVDRKGAQIVELCCHTLQPACVVGFILCVALIVIGAVGNKKMLVGGLVGLFICGLCYVFATSPVEILNVFSSFVKS